MDNVFRQLKQIARGIVACYPPPDFYGDHAQAVEASRRFYHTEGAILRLRQELDGRLENDFGHGIRHVEKVAIDAGALVIIENRQQGAEPAVRQRDLLMAQCAGLLHDICRKEKAHADKGALAAADILTDFPFTEKERATICAAIRNHEAFAGPTPLTTGQAGMVSNCLYDADKFRWGPDNFTHTIWDMVTFLNPSLQRFVTHYPRGMNLLHKIRDTFRSATGRHYGPQFIDLGIAIGEELYQVIQTKFMERA